VTLTEAAALTTSSHLTSLLMADEYSGSREEPLINSLQEAHYEAMFPPGRQLQQLRELLIGAALLRSQVDLRQLTGLKTLALKTTPEDISAYKSEGAAQLAAGLKALTIVKHLDELRLCTSEIEYSAGVWTSLGAVTGLTSIEAWCAPLSGEHLLPLTSCHRLERLAIIRGPKTHQGFVPGFGFTIGLSSKVRARHRKQLTDRHRHAGILCLNVLSSNRC